MDTYAQLLYDVERYVARFLLCAGRKASLRLETCSSFNVVRTEFFTEQRQVTGRVGQSTKKTGKMSVFQDLPELDVVRKIRCHCAIKG